MSVLLVNPYIVHPFPSPYTPLGVGYLAAYLREHGVEAHVLDMANNRMSLGALRAHMERTRPSLVGLSVHYSNLRTSAKIVKIAKEVSPECVTVMGGSWPSSIPHRIVEGVPELDACVRHEGEVTLLEIVRRMEAAGGAARLDWSGIAGVTYRGPDGRARNNRDRALVPDLDSLPSPYLTEGVYDLTRYKVGSLLTARGCHMKCGFCAAREVFQGELRLSGVDRIVAEARVIYAAGLREFVFFDDTFSIHPKKSLPLLRAFRDEMPDVALQSNARFDSVNPELLAEMKAAGFYILNLGLETITKATVKAMAKGVNEQQVEKSHRWIKDAGIKTLINLIVGLPGDDRDAIMRTFEFAKSLGANVYTVHVLRPFPNTDLYRNSVHHGLSFATDEGMLLRRADTGELRYEEMLDLAKVAGDYFEMGDFFNKILMAERIDIYGTHPTRSLMG